MWAIDTSFPCEHCCFSYWYAADCMLTTLMSRWTILTEASINDRGPIGVISKRVYSCRNDVGRSSYRLRPSMASLSYCACSLQLLLMFVRLPRTLDHLTWLAKGTVVSREFTTACTSPLKVWFLRIQTRLNFRPLYQYLGLLSRAFYCTQQKKASDEEWRDYQTMLGLIYDNVQNSSYCLYRW